MIKNPYSMKKFLMYTVYGLLECLLLFCPEQNPILCNHAFTFIMLICKGFPFREILQIRQGTSKVRKRAKRDNTKKPQRTRHH